MEAVNLEDFESALASGRIPGSQILLAIIEEIRLNSNNSSRPVWDQWDQWNNWDKGTEWQEMAR